METLRQMHNRNRNSRLVHNASSRDLTDEEARLLQWDEGLNLGDAQPIDFIAAVEPRIQGIATSEAEKNAIRQRVTGLLIGHKQRHVLPAGERKALKELRSDKSIVILPADKGRATVVMDRATYIGKAQALLDDTSAYKAIRTDPTTSMKNQLNKIMDGLKKRGGINEEDLRAIRPRDSAMARFYGLPKIHKEGTPLRPIVALRGTPMFGLAKWLSRKLQHLVEDNTTTVKSSQEFLQRLKTLRIREDEIMISFDVTSLFTSIPQELAISTIKDLLQLKGLRSKGSLGIEDVVKLLRLCLKTYFTFQGTIYEQIKGTPMGSPISGVIAEAVLQCLESRAMADCQPEFWARYVDDTFVIVKRARKTALMERLNSIFPDIQFTAEEETNGSLAFLDVLVTRQTNGALHTTVYRKATHTDRMLHYMSNHPAAHKISCVRTLFARIDTHCNTRKAKQVERAHLYQVCRENGYPTGFIRRYSKRQEPRRAPNDPGVTSRVTIPYVQGVSEATARILAPHNIEVAHRPDQTLRMKVMCPKEPLPKEERSSVVYRVHCKDCQCNYTGETAKRIKTRIHEHKLAVRRQEQYSQIWTHMINNGHSFDFKGAEAIAQDASKGGRLLKEAWFSNMDSINRCIDLPPAYQALRAYKEHVKRRMPAVRDGIRTGGDIYCMAKQKEDFKDMEMVGRDEEASESQTSKGTKEGGGGHDEGLQGGGDHGRVLGVLDLTEGMPMGGGRTAERGRRLRMEDESLKQHVDRGTRGEEKQEKGRLIGMDEGRQEQCVGRQTGGGEKPKKGSPTGMDVGMQEQHVSQQVKGGGILEKRRLTGMEEQHAVQQTRKGKLGKGKWIEMDDGKQEQQVDRRTRRGGKLRRGTLTGMDDGRQEQYVDQQVRGGELLEKGRLTGMDDERLDRQIRDREKLEKERRGGVKPRRGGLIGRYDGKQEQHADQQTGMREKLEKGGLIGMDEGRQERHIDSKARRGEKLEEGNEIGTDDGMQERQADQQASKENKKGKLQGRTLVVPDWKVHPMSKKERLESRLVTAVQGGGGGTEQKNAKLQCNKERAGQLRQLQAIRKSGPITRAMSKQFGQQGDKKNFPTP